MIVTYPGVTGGQMRLMISVIIPVYNAERFLRQTVESVLALTEVVEVILFDDGSTDGSLELELELARNDARVKLHQHPGGVNRGVSATRNAAVRVTSQDLIAFLDSDDRFLANRFSAEHRVFAEHADAEGVYGAIGILVHDEQARSDYASRFQSELTTIRKRVPPEALFEGLSGGILDFGHFSLDGLTVKRSVLMAMPQLFREDLSMHEDSEFLTRLAYHARLYPGSLETPIALRGVHGENRITRNDRIAYTRLAQFTHLSGWAVEYGVPKAAQERFLAEKTHYEMRVASLEKKRGRVLRLMLMHPSQFKRPDSIHSLIDSFSTRGGWLNRLAHGLSAKVFNLLWRLKGAQPPTTTTENEELLFKR